MPQWEVCRNFKGEMETGVRKKRQAAVSAQVKISACTVAEKDLREMCRDSGIDSSSSASCPTLGVEMDEMLEDSENLNKVIEKETDATMESSEQQINETSSCNELVHEDVVHEDTPFRENEMIGDPEQGNDGHELNGEVSNAPTSQSSDSSGNPMWL